MFATGLLASNEIVQLWPNEEATVQCRYAEASITMARARRCNVCRRGRQLALRRQSPGHHKTPPPIIKLSDFVCVVGASLYSNFELNSRCALQAVRQWDISRRRCTRSLEGHPDFVW